MRRTYVHEASAVMAPGSDPAALGGAVTVRTEFAAEEAAVHARIRGALAAGTQVGPDGRTHTWSLSGG